MGTVTSDTSSSVFCVDFLPVESVIHPVSDLSCRHQDPTNNILVTVTIPSLPCLSIPPFPIPHRSPRMLLCLCICSGLVNLTSGRLPYTCDGQVIHWRVDLLDHKAASSTLKSRLICWVEWSWLLTWARHCVGGFLLETLEPASWMFPSFLQQNRWYSHPTTQSTRSDNERVAPPRDGVFGGSVRPTQ